MGLNQNPESGDVNMVSDITQSLFANQNFPGSDLIARNIHRGRDHGLPAYNEYREVCGMPKACSWDNPPKEIPSDLWKTLSTLYNSPADIDLFSAGMAETPLNGAHVGATFACIIGQQFKALKDGDRFFFTHNQNPNPFTPEQMANINSRNLGDIICDNTDIKEMRKNVFIYKSDTFQCEKNAKLDLNLLFPSP